MLGCRSCQPLAARCWGHGLAQLPLHQVPLFLLAMTCPPAPRHPSILEDYLPSRFMAPACEELGLCWYGWELNLPSSSLPGSAASAACWVLPLALSRAIGVEQPHSAAKGTGSVGAHRT